MNEFDKILADFHAQNMVISEMLREAEFLSSKNDISSLQRALQMYNQITYQTGTCEKFELRKKQIREKIENLK